MTLSIRTISRDELAAFRHAAMGAFGADPEEDSAEADERSARTLELDRSYAAFDGADIVGTSSTFSLELAIPGGSLPMGGFTMATVRPTHRRRGILRDMLSAHFRDVRARGEPLSGLWASEASIYGRFGYGVSAEGHQLRYAHLELPEGDCDPVELVDTDRAAELLPAAYARIASQRPGTFARTDAWWQTRCFHDPPERRGGASARRHAVALRDGEPTGYVVYRQRASWEGAVADGSIEIVEMIAADLRAELALWRLVSNIDLFPRVSWWNAPVDAPLPWLTSDRRRLTRTRTDTLWLRICDVQAALTSRAYASDGELTLAIDDALFPDNARTYELRVDGGRATCELSSAAPELKLDIDALSSLYLGGIRPSTLARAGRIDGPPAALAVADRLFFWPVAPWCPEIF